MSISHERLKSQASTPAAQWPLRLLVAASLVLPISIFLIASWISYKDHFTEAEDRLQRTVGTLQEHAIKVFETFEISERYLEELFNGVSDAAIRRDEATYSAHIRNFIQKLPQLRDMWVIDGDGRPLVAGTVYPMPPNFNVSDRNYFRVPKTGGTDTFISEVMRARVVGTDFFSISRARMTPDHRFDGVYVVSIAPEYFTHYYSSFPKMDFTTAGLLRTDGAILARYPAMNIKSKLPPDAALMKSIRLHPQAGLVIGPSYYDRVERIIAYRKLPNQSVYVYAALNTSAVRADWMRDMATHLVFGAPTTLAIFILALLTLRNTRRLSTAYAQLREEIARRQTTELALRQAQKMEAVGRLTGGIAHDFNNLLTAIIGNAEMAIRRAEPDNERLNRSLTSIRQASLRAATLVQRLLSFSRQHPQEVKTVDINRLVGDMSDLLHRTIGETVTIETVLAGGLWKTSVDPNQLESAILNLAVNARDAMPNGGHLIIETSNAYLDEKFISSVGGDVKSGQYVMVAVSDTGTGMTAEIRDKAFEPFFTTKPTGVGSGLGLSMVYGFVKQSDGHIQIYSEPGEGTSIKMYFPRLADKDALPVSQNVEAPPLPQGDRYHECILLVEDDDDVSRFVVEVLGEFGYRIEQARTGPEALDILKKTPEIALLFTDVVLPGGMNGRELANEVHKLRPHLPVLFATGYTRNAIVHHGKLDSDIDLLTKPFTTDTLIRKVRQVLDGKRK